MPAIQGELRGGSPGRRALEGILACYMQTQQPTDRSTVGAKSPKVFPEGGDVILGLGGAKGQEGHFA